MHKDMYAQGKQKALKAHQRLPLSPAQLPLEGLLSPQGLLQACTWFLSFHFTVINSAATITRVLYVSYLFWGLFFFLLFETGTHYTVQAGLNSL